jgi:nucleotide-binding universal stress UspA family protein
LQAALELRGRVRRHDFQARSWASIWPHLTTAQVAAALTRMTPEKPLRYDRQAEALATIAPLLTSPELCHVLRWTVRNHDEVWPELVEPFLRASLQQQPQETFEALDALLEEAGRRPREEAIWGLVKLAPLIARLGGRRGLQIVERAFVQASARWP